MLDTALRVAEIFAYFGGPAAVIYLARKVGKLHRLIDAEPTLTDIANQFKKNGGHSLKDTVDRIEGLARAAVQTTVQQNLVLEQQNQALARIQAAVETVKSRVT